MSAPAMASDDEDIIDSRKVLAALTAKRWWVLGSMVFFTAAFTGAAFLMTPIYRSTTILGGIASLAGINVSSKTSMTEEALAVLKSREFTERFIADETLMPKLFARKWDAASGKWKGEPPTPDRAYRYFNEKIRSVDQDKKSGLVTVQIDWKNRFESAAWVNELVHRLNQEMRTRAIADADASLGYLDRELQSTTVVVTHDAIGHLIESQVKQRMLATVNKEYAFRVVDRGMPADADDPIKPQKLIMIAAGFTLGVMIGTIFALVSGGSRRQTVESER
jgi:uncharacterized protein involved in exopolysaccharide biosynthesis